MSSWARVGAKCVIINSIRWRKDRSHFSPIPPEGTLCVVAGLYDRRDGPSVLIDGWPNMCPNHRVDVGWLVSRFRPIVSQEDDTSMFKSLLKPTEVSA